jgi:UDP-3-O-[3-hydroxymyristoyl] glucosamine N-acyltransferase
MGYTVQQIAKIVNGVIEGDTNEPIVNLSRIEDGGKGTISFLDNKKYTNCIYTTNATAVIVNEDFIPEQSINTALIKVKNVRDCFEKLLKCFESVKNESGVHNNCCIESTAKLGENVYVGAMAYIGSNVIISDNVKIHPHCYIGDYVTIGANTIIHSGVKIYQNCKIGKNCIIHAGVVIGADGFGYTPNENYELNKVSQIGNVIIEQDVEIGANTTVDRATIGSTIIKKGAKLDNLVQIAHNVEIGEHTAIAAQTGISGSCRIGKNCILGGQVGVADHITIADGVRIAAQSGIAKNINEKGSTVQGSPAFNHLDFKRSYVNFIKLPQFIKRLEKN